MTSDFAMVTTVKREFARRLPTDLVTLVLEFANWANVERKRSCINELRRFVKIAHLVILDTRVMHGVVPVIRTTLPHLSLKHPPKAPFKDYHGGFARDRQKDDQRYFDFIAIENRRLFGQRSVEENRYISCMIPVKFRLPEVNNLARNWFQQLGQNLR